jgi:hypothetical protein
MIPYTGDFNTPSDRDLYYSGQLKNIEGQWYWTEYHVGYAQRPMDTSDNFVTLDDATAHFNKRLSDCRKSWGHNGARWSELVEGDLATGNYRIRFQSIRKNGKPGTLTGLMYIWKINRANVQVPCS